MTCQQPCAGKDCERGDHPCGEDLPCKFHPTDATLRKRIEDRIEGIRADLSRTRFGGVERKAFAVCCEFAIRELQHILSGEPVNG